MSSSIHKKKEDRDKEDLNALLQKSSGDIDNLTDDEVTKLQSLCTKRVIKQLRETYAEFYPGVNPLIACIRDESYRRRTTQKNTAKKLGISYGHYNKILTGKMNIGISVAKQIHKKIGLDGNFILENLT